MGGLCKQNRLHRRLEYSRNGPGVDEPPTVSENCHYDVAKPP
jgi:hypothetical protein